MQTSPSAKPHPSALTRGRPSPASGTRPALLSAVVQVPRLPPLHLAPVTDVASRRRRCAPNAQPSRLRRSVGRWGRVASWCHRGFVVLEAFPGASLPARPHRYASAKEALIKITALFFPETETLAETDRSCRTSRNLETRFRRTDYLLNILVKISQILSVILSSILASRFFNLVLSIVLIWSNAISP